jgi:hypothetical protein
MYIYMLLPTRNHTISEKVERVYGSNFQKLAVMYAFLKIQIPTVLPGTRFSRTTSAHMHKSKAP